MSPYTTGTFTDTSNQGQSGSASGLKRIPWIHHAPAASRAMCTGTAQNSQPSSRSGYRDSSQSPVVQLLEARAEQSEYSYSALQANQPTDESSVQDTPSVPEPQCADSAPGLSYEDFQLPPYPTSDPSSQPGYSYPYSAPRSWNDPRTTQPRPSEAHFSSAPAPAQDTQGWTLPYPLHYPAPNTQYQTQKIPQSASTLRSYWRR